jgi:MoaD family protein
MNIKIKLSQVLQQFTEQREVVEVKGSTVNECLDDLIRQYPETKKRLFNKDGALLVLFFLNGENVYKNDLSRPVADGDELYIVPIFAGG